MARISIAGNSAALVPEWHGVTQGPYMETVRSWFSVWQSYLLYQIGGAGATSILGCNPQNNILLPLTTILLSSPPVFIFSLVTNPVLQRPILFFYGDPLCLCFLFYF